MVHLRDLVDRPYVHFQATLVRGGDEALGDQTLPADAHWYLGALPVEGIRRSTHRRCREFRDLTRTQRAAQTGAQALAQLRQPCIGEGTDAYPVEGLFALDDIGQGADHRVVLRIDVEEGMWKLLEEFHQQGDLVPASDSCRADVGPVEFADHSDGVSYPVEGVVVEGHDVAVRCQMHIGLEIAVAQLGRSAERCHGVLGRHFVSAAVGKGSRVRAGEEAGHRRTLPSGETATGWCAPGDSFLDVDRTDRFAEVVAAADASIRLDEAAALIAAHAYPSLDPADPLQELDRLADAVREPTLDGVSRLLFRDLAFTGNRDNYFDPRNTYINDVLERRLGIPISLAVVMIEVGRRLSVPIDGVSMPGHFLVRDRVDRGLFIDVFAGGQHLDSAGCERLYAATTGQGGFSNEYLEPVSRVKIIERMLANLEQIHRGSSDLSELTWVIELQVRLPGSDPSRRSALGVVLTARGQYDRAAVAFEAAAEDADSETAEELLSRAQHARARLN